MSFLSLEISIIYFHATSLFDLEILTFRLFSLSKYFILETLHRHLMCDVNHLYFNAFLSLDEFCMFLLFKGNQTFHLRNIELSVNM